MAATNVTVLLITERSVLRFMTAIKKPTFRQKGNVLKTSLIPFIFLPMYNIMYIVIFIYFKVYILYGECHISKIYFRNHSIILYKVDYFNFQ